MISTIGIFGIAPASKACMSISRKSVSKRTGTSKRKPAVTTAPAEGMAPGAKVTIPVVASTLTSGAEFLDAIGRDAHCSSDGLYDVARISGKGASVRLHKLKRGARAISHSDCLIRWARRCARRAGGAIGAIAPAKAIKPTAPLLEEFDDLRKLRETLDAVASFIAAPRMRPAGVARLAIGAERHDLCAPLRSAAPAQRDIERKADLVKIAHAGCARLEVALAARDSPRQGARDLRLRTAEALDILRSDVDRDRTPDARRRLARRRRAGHPRRARAA